MKSDLLEFIAQEVGDNGKEMKVSDIKLEYDDGRVEYLWCPELQEYLKESYECRLCYNDDGSFSWGRAFRCMFQREIYGERVPFHCYGLRGGQDAGFSKRKYQWIESEGGYEFELTPASQSSGCLGVLALLVGAGSTLLYALL